MFLLVYQNGIVVVTIFFFSDFKLNWGDNIIIVDFLFLRGNQFDVLSHFKFLIFKNSKEKILKRTKKQVNIFQLFLPTFFPFKNMADKIKEKPISFIEIKISWCWRSRYYKRRILTTIHNDTVGALAHHHHLLYTIH